MIFQQNDKLLMIGDSITDCGRNRPIGESRKDGLGKGYVSIVDAMLQAVYPELAARVINMGISGNTVRNLKERWQSDVIELKPDWLSIMIGINDVWRQFDNPTAKETHIHIEEYEHTLTELVRVSRPLVKGLVLMTPFYIEPNRNDAMRAMMDEYGSVVQRIALSQDAIFIDTQAVFDNILKHVYPAALAWDRVHPNMTGHMALARAFLQATGFVWR